MWYEADRKRSRYHHLADYLYDIQVDRELDVAENEIEQLKAELAETRADWSEMVEQRDETMIMLCDLVFALEEFANIPPIIRPVYEQAKKFVGLDEHEQDH